MEIILVVIGVAAGIIIGFLYAKSKLQSNSSSQLQEEQQKFITLDKSFAEFKASSNSQIQSIKDATIEKTNEIVDLRQELSRKTDELNVASSNAASLKSNLGSLQETLNEKITLANNIKLELDRKVELLNDVNKQLATAVAGVKSSSTTIEEKNTEIGTIKFDLQRTKEQLKLSDEQLATATAGVKSLGITIEEKNTELGVVKIELQKTKEQLKLSDEQLATATAGVKSLSKTVEEKGTELASIRVELQKVKEELKISGEALATSKANNVSLTEKLETQKKEIEELGKKISTEFENIANRILDSKSEKFTELNKTNLKEILEPLGKNITEFKQKVDDVYVKESKERFSLGEKVKELAVLNQQISEEARNLTKALKGESKTQGRWGEMILESILERSGLVKDREYFMEHELLDADGNPLKSDSEGKKMRPDAVIKYPDNRSVIIDSKVSLNAFTRLIASNDADEQKNELQSHVAAIKNHIVTLSAKGYDDYDKALDFVMMFVPSEPAYIAALQGDPDLWNFAYDKRILLLSPTNLITSLKLIVDLWKREYQNQNALEIAERGAKLYDKFVGFIANLDDVGDHLEKAHGKYSEAYKQLSTGNDNLVSQATKLKNLGLKTKKELPKEIVNSALGDELL